MADEFDVHAIRHKLKLLSDEGKHAYFDNRDGATCPVCGEVFDELMASRAPTGRLSPDRSLDLCFLNEAESFFVFTHARGT